MEFLDTIGSPDGVFWTPLGHLMEFFGSLPLLPLACSVGNFQINELISNNPDQLYQTLAFFH